MKSWRTSDARQFRMQGCYKSYVTAKFDWLCLSKEELIDIVDGIGWQVAQFLEDETDAYVGVIEKESAVI